MQGCLLDGYKMSLYPKSLLQNSQYSHALHELGKENCFWTKKMLSTLSYQLRSALRYWLYEEWQMEMSADFHDLLLSCLRKKDIEGLRHLLFKRLERGPLSGRAQ